MVDMSQSGKPDIRDLYREEIIARCRISGLYSTLLLSQELPDLKVTCAAHDWSLLTIKSITEDLTIRIPKGVRPINGYSKYFKTGSKEITKTLSELNNAINYHSYLSTRIEQCGKGVL
jgi:hypothetical protein